MRIFEILSSVIFGRRNNKQRFVDNTPISENTDFIATPPRDPLSALEILPELRAIHTLIASAVNRLSWSVESYLEILDRFVPDELKTSRLDYTAGVLAADYFMLGEAFVSTELTRIHPRQPGGVRLAKSETQLYPDSPLASAAWLIRRLWEYHRASTQLIVLMGAGAFISPEGSAMPWTDDELTQLRSMLRDKVRRGGVGGLEPISVPVEIKAIQVDVDKYRLIEIYTQLVREVCNLFGIDSSLLNDPENKTYSNKDLALRALYTNIVIPLAYELKYKLEIAFENKIRITIDHSNIEVLHQDKQAQADYVIKLVQAGIIDLEEAREMLELTRRVNA